MPRRLSSCASITPRYCLCRAGKSSWQVCAAESGSVAALHVTCGFVMSDSRGGVFMKQTRQHGQKAECFLSSPLCMSESFSPRAAAASWPPSKGVAETVYMSRSDCLWCYLFKLPVICVHLLEQTRIGYSPIRDQRFQVNNKDKYDQTRVATLPLFKTLIEFSSFCVNSSHLWHLGIIWADSLILVPKMKHLWLTWLQSFRLYNSYTPFKLWRATQNNTERPWVWQLLSAFSHNPQWHNHLQGLQA